MAGATAPGLLIDSDQLTGAPALAVTEAGNGAAMLVVGSRGVGAFTAMLLGSVSRYAALHASCPVVVIPDESWAAHKLIGVGVADPEGSPAALDFAFEEAARRQAVLAVYAWHTPEFDISRAGRARRWRTGVGGGQAARGRRPSRWAPALRVSSPTR